MDEKMRHGALFNGIGGFQLAAHWMGWENIFHCEIDQFCNQVVKRHFPESICYEDIRRTDFKEWRGAIDILTGGFPCQPYSTAGKRLGKNDVRHLWPEMLRAIRQVRPRWIVGENVRGLTNWNGGLVFDEVQADLEAEDYEVLPFLLPAAGIGAPHRRDRIWFIANANRGRYGGHEFGEDRCSSDADKEKENKRERVRTLFNGTVSAGAPSYSERLSERKPANQTHPESDEGYARIEPIGSGDRWGRFPTQSPFCRGDDEFPGRLDRIRSLGNAIVPWLVLQIFKTIEEYEKLNPHPITPLKSEK